MDPPAPWAAENFEKAGRQEGRVWRRASHERDKGQTIFRERQAPAH